MNPVAGRLLHLLAAAGAIITLGVVMLAAPALAQAGVPVVGEVPGGTAPLIVLGSGLTLTLGALVFMVRQVANGKLVPAQTADREEKLLGLLAESSTRESKVAEMLRTERERSDSYRQAWNRMSGGPT